MKLFVAVYDDARLLPHFLRHYTKLGVDHFYVAVGPGMDEHVRPYSHDHPIVIYDALDVLDSVFGGHSAVDQMRHQHQSDGEWVFIVDLDEFVEFTVPITSIIAHAERDDANAVRGIMFDRFARNGQLIGFDPDSDLNEIYPVRSRFTAVVMGGDDAKCVLVKGLLRAVKAHHRFAGERLASTTLNISHYRCHENTINRLKVVVDGGGYFADQNIRAIEHYEIYGRFNWRSFGGRDDGRFPSDAEVFDERSYLIQHPDVRCAVEGGTFQSAWDHYEHHGRAESRSLRWHKANLPMPSQSQIGALERVEFDLLANGGFVASKLIIPVASDYDVSLRLGTTDVPTFFQIFSEREYDSADLPVSAQTIVDLGANIGLAAVFFGLKYRKATVVCIEPEATNFQALVGNTIGLGNRVICKRAAVWTADGTVGLNTEKLGHWGARICREGDTTQSITMDSLLRSFPIIDILKVDIEGTEIDIFATNSEEWLSRVKMVIVEPHDWLRPGCEAAVREALDDFEELAPRGENLFFRRIQSI